MRTYNIKDWRPFFQQTLDNINHSSNRALGGTISPAQVNTPLLDDSVRDLRTMVQATGYNQRAPIQGMKDIRVGSYVFIDHADNNKAFAKSFHLKRSQLYLVYRIDRTLEPFKYYVKTLTGQPLPRFLYRNQLKKAYGNIQKRIFNIDRIVKKRTDPDGKTYYLIRWLNYPPSHDSWEPAKFIDKQLAEAQHEKNQLLAKIQRSKT